MNSGMCAWHEINSAFDVMRFMEKMCFFHDCCVKEMAYLSGAYVTEKLSMFPINNRRVLRVLIQRQCEKNPVIEMEFGGLKYLKLSPVGEEYTCEILDSTMFIKDGEIYWCDCGGLTENDLEEYTGTIICASNLRWRSIEFFVGEKEFYYSKIDHSSSP